MSGYSETVLQWLDQFMWETQVLVFLINILGAIISIHYEITSRYQIGLIFIRNWKLYCQNTSLIYSKTSFISNE